MHDPTIRSTAIRRSWTDWLIYVAPGILIAIAVFGVGLSGVGTGEVMGAIVEWAYAHLILHGFVMGGAWKILPALPFWLLLYVGFGTLFYFLLESRPRAWRVGLRVTVCWASLLAAEFLLVALLSVNGVLTE